MMMMVMMMMMMSILINILITYLYSYQSFLVGGFNHLEKYESQWEGLSHILWKIKNVPNHQPVLIAYPPIFKSLLWKPRPVWGALTPSPAWVYWDLPAAAESITRLVIPRSTGWYGEYVGISIEYGDYIYIFICIYWTWLVVYLPLWKMMEWVTVGIMKFPIYGKS